VTTTAAGAGQARRLVQAGLGTGVVFAASGAIFGTWASRIPAVRDQVAASPAELGRALLGIAVGSVVAMPLTGGVAARVGSRLVIAGGAALVLGVVVAIPDVADVGTLGLALVAFGVGFGAWDVAMNIQGHAVEQRADRPWMPRYHGAWSAGTMLAAALGALAAARGVPIATHFRFAAAACALLVVAGLLTWIDDRQPRPPRTGRPRKLRLSRTVVAIGLLTLCATVVEGVANDWLALLLVDELGVDGGAAALGFTVFAAAMAVTRFAGPVLLDRWGRVGALRRAGVVAALGVTTTLVAPALPLALVGALLWGAGVALVFPAAMSAAGDASDRPSSAIAAVSTIGYGGFLLGPPLVGYLAEALGLGRALWVCVGMSAGIVALARYAAPPRRARLPGSAGG
jgi:MFS family permease